MKQNILDVVSYLFNNVTQQKRHLLFNQKLLINKLRKAGFEAEKIYEAFSWLALLAEPQLAQPKTSKSLRIFSQEEILRIEAVGRSFILEQEQIEVLTSKTREIVINQLMQLDKYNINLHDVKLAIFLVLMSQQESTSNEQLRKYLLETSAHKV